MERTCACLLSERSPKWGSGSVRPSAHGGCCHTGKLEVAQCSQPMAAFPGHAVHHWGDFHVQPQQLKSSGWVRAVGGFVIAPKPVTITPLHRVIGFFVVLPGVCQATTLLSEHTAPHRPVKLVVSTRVFKPKKNGWYTDPSPGHRTGHQFVYSPATTVEWDAVRRDIKMGAETHCGCCSFREAVEKELTSVFLFASGEAAALRGGPPRLEVGLGGLQKPLVRQVVPWQFRSAGMAQKDY